MAEKEKTAAADPDGIAKAKKQLNEDFPDVQNHPKGLLDLLEIQQLESYMQDKQDFTIHDCKVALYDIFNDLKALGTIVGCYNSLGYVHKEFFYTIVFSLCSINYDLILGVRCLYMTSCKIILHISYHVVVLIRSMGNVCID